MNTKKYILGLGVAFSMLSLTSCLFEEENFFDESAALRGQHFTESINEVLYTPENGWVLQYFPNSSPLLEVYHDGSFENFYQKGYNIFVRFFENETCILTSNHEFIRENIMSNTPGVMRSDTSLFCINEQDGPVLSFNSWNDILSVFSDPVDPVSCKAGNFEDKNGQGLEGDNEFVVLTVSPDLLEMRGERHDARVRLVKADRPQDEYIAAVQGVEKKFMQSPVKEFLVIGSKENFADTVYAYDYSTGLIDFAPNQGEEWIDETEAFICCTEGVRFQFAHKFGYSHVKSVGDTLKWDVPAVAFNFSEDGNTMVSDNGELTLIPNWQKYVVSCLGKSRQVTFEKEEGACDAWKQLCADLDAAIKSAYSKQSLMNITFGKSSESAANQRTGLIFQTTSSAFIGFNATASVNGDVVTFEIDTENPSGNFKNYVSKGIDGAFVAVADFLRGSWTMAYDNTFAPTYVTLTNTTDATKKLTLKVVK